MKNQSLLQTIKAMLAIAWNYWEQHAKSLKAIEKVYIRQWPGDTVVDGYTLVVVHIIPFGNLYKVSQSYYLKGEVQLEKSWIASYGWHSNGHLIELGGDRYCIFNPEQGLLYIEYPDNTVEQYNEI